MTKLLYTSSPLDIIWFLASQMCSIAPHTTAMIYFLNMVQCLLLILIKSAKISACCTLSSSPVLLSIHNPFANYYKNFYLFFSIFCTSFFLIQKSLNDINKFLYNIISSHKIRCTLATSLPAILPTLWRKGL